MGISCNFLNTKMSQTRCKTVGINTSNSTHHLAHNNGSNGVSYLTWKHHRRSFPAKYQNQDLGYASDTTSTLWRKLEMITSEGRGITEQRVNLVRTLPRRKPNVREEDQKIREPASCCEVIEHVTCTITHDGFARQGLRRWPQLWNFVRHRWTQLGFVHLTGIYSQPHRAYAIVTIRLSTSAGSCSVLENRHHSAQHERMTNVWRL